MSQSSRQPKKSPAAIAEPPEIGLSGDVSFVTSLTSGQWTTLRQRILADLRNHPPSLLFGDAAERGKVYRWGLASALAEPCSDSLQWLSRVASGAGVRGKRFRGFEPSEAIRQFQESIQQRRCSLAVAGEAAIWAAAMPGLLNHLDENEWWSLLGAIQDFRDGFNHRDPFDPAALLGVAEIGLTLAWGLRALPSCRRLSESSTAALRRWCEQDDLAVTTVLSRPHEARLVLASLLRIRKLLPAVAALAKSSRKKKKNRPDRKREKNKPLVALAGKLDETGIELATWVAAITRPGGVQTLSPLVQRDIRDDLGDDGLLSWAAALESDVLTPAMQASLGKSKTGGRLAWQVSLPESMLHDDDAKIACLLPEWDVRRGRMIVDYRDKTTRLEILAGKKPILSGACESSLLVDGQPVRAIGDWVSTCEYTDDDVHYLELEQPHEDGYVLQRQLMVIREDRCCFYADAVIQGRLQWQDGEPARTPVSDKNGPRQNASQPLPLIEYRVRIPLADSIQLKPQKQTHECFLEDGRRRAMVLPLSAGEWRNVAMESPVTSLESTTDRHLLLTACGRGQLYAPLWIDLSRWRFSSKRTWRRLTVAHQLRQLPPSSAVAYRIQVGASQWILYRSMTPPSPRTFFGKHMIADFYCARFDASESSFEDLITVEDDPSDGV